MAHDKLTCEHCGTLNPTHRAECELCLRSLASVRASRAKGSLPRLLFVAMLLTFAFFVLPGALVMKVMTRHYPAPNVACCYLAAWGIAIWLGRIFEPKDRYEVREGVSMGVDLEEIGIGVSFNSNSGQQQLDMLHVLLGFALFPVNVLVGCWGAVARNLAK